MLCGWQQDLKNVSIRNAQLMPNLFIILGGGKSYCNVSCVYHRLVLVFKLCHLCVLDSGVSKRLSTGRVFPLPYAVAFRL